MSAVGQTNPFSDASEYNSLAFIIARATDEMQTVSIVQVKAVDTAALTVDVQVLVNLMTGANISVPHGVISARPYYRAQGGTSGIILDPAAGDIGVMVFASRDSSAVVSAKGLANPGSQRRFSWSDGVYFGGILNPTPTQYLKFAGGGITLLSPSAVTIRSPDNTVNGPLEVTGVATFDTDVHILGDLFLTGVLHGSSAIFSGNVTAASFTGGGGGGGGTVTSVGISTPGSGVVVGGGPITTAGTLTVDLSSTAYAALALAVTALQSISITTGTGLTGGPLTASGTTVALSAATIASLLPAGPVQGDIVYYNGAAWALLAPGTAGYVLQTNGASANPTWVAAGGGGGGLPTALNIPNLQYWFDASQINANAGSGVPILQNFNPPLSAMSPARSTPPNGVIAAAQLSSKNVIDMGTGSGGYLFTNGAPFLTASTIFAVFNASNVSATNAIVSGAAGGSVAFSVSGGSIILVDQFVAVVATSTAVLANSTWFQANATFVPATGAYAFRIASTAEGSGTASTFSVTNSSTAIGYTPGAGQNFAGSIAEIIVFDRVLSGPEISAIEAYILAKWGV